MGRFGASPQDGAETKPPGRGSAGGVPPRSTSEQVEYPLSAEVYKAILDSLNDGVYLVDRDRRIIYWNRGAEQITGFLRQQVVGRESPEELLGYSTVDGRDPCGDSCPLLRTIQDGKPRSAELYLRHREGHCVPVWLRTTPIRDAGGEIMGAAEVFKRRSNLAWRRRKASELGVHGCLDELTGAAGTPTRGRRRAETLDPGPYHPRRVNFLLASTGPLW